jgi:uracil-DNA glycosylase
MLSKTTYSVDKTWKEKFPDNNVNLSGNDITESIYESWTPLFDRLFSDQRFKSRIEKGLSDEMKDNLNLIMYPKPDFIFNAFGLTSLKKLKVVILGQDPYFNHEMHENKIVPQAMGLSFSVPNGVEIPSSLKNVYANLKKYGHIKKMPEHGNLESWAKQGVLMLNTSLTVKTGSANKNCHQFIWKWFTDEIISYISENKSNVIFVLWGSPAYAKKDLIDTSKHELIVSSHPSGLSFAKPMSGHPAFVNQDHFGKINAKLKEWGKSEIDWTIN